MQPEILEDVARRLSKSPLLPPDAAVLFRILDAAEPALRRRPPMVPGPLRPRPDQTSIPCPGLPSLPS